MPTPRLSPQEEHNGFARFHEAAGGTLLLCRGIDLPHKTGRPLSRLWSPYRNGKERCHVGFVQVGFVQERSKSAGPGSLGPLYWILASVRPYRPHLFQVVPKRPGPKEVNL